jgi:hypothetical protein
LGTKKRGFRAKNRRRQPELANSHKKERENAELYLRRPEMRIQINMSVLLRAMLRICLTSGPMIWYT